MKIFLFILLVLACVVYLVVIIHCIQVYRGIFKERKKNIHINANMNSLWKERLR